MSSISRTFLCTVYSSEETYFKFVWQKCMKKQKYTKLLSIVHENTLQVLNLYIMKLLLNLYVSAIRRKMTIVAISCRTDMMTVKIIEDYYAL